MTNMLSGCGAAVLAVACLGATGASATTYSIDFPWAKDASVCNKFGSLQLCSQTLIFGSPLSVKAGDEFDIHLDLGFVGHIQGSMTFSDAYAAVFDSKTKPGGGPGPHMALSTLVMNGYSGPANPLAGPTVYSRDTYLALGGFAGPNPGFFLTGADVVIKVLNDDPNPVTGLALGSAVGVPEPGTWAMMILGFGVMGGVLRRRRTAAA